ncbi:hypothetical protein [Streptomyces sp. NPDC097619]|uniref:hypothetical protein n=1 Tax=Streptomyces sp. NPDC097619 TaxID=3157228 RepID=UPI00331A1BB9
MTRGGPARLTRYMMPTAIALVVAVLALTGYAMLSGDGTPDSSKPSAAAGPTASASASAGYAPPRDWTEPDRWATLPRGARTNEHGREVAFPHTELGAAAMMVSSSATLLEGAHGNVAEHDVLFDSYLIAADRTEEIRQATKAAAVAADKELRRSMGLPESGALPPGVYVRVQPTAFKIIKSGQDEVGAWMLSRVTTKTGETAKEAGSHMRSLVAVRWDGDDWKSSTAAYGRAMAVSEPKPEIVAPGDPLFNTSGWTAIREAS